MVLKFPPDMNKKEIHIVGLYVNENDADLNKQLKYYREKRVTRNFEYRKVLLEYIWK